MVSEPATKPKRAPRRTKAEIQAERKDAAGQAAAKLVGVMERAAVSLVGEEGRLEPIEHALIDDSLAELLARANPRKMEKYAGVIASVSLAAGVLLYGARVSMLYRAQHPAPAPAPAHMPQAGADVVDAHLDELLAAPIPHGSTL